MGRSIGRCGRALNLAIGPCISSANSHIAQVAITSRLSVSMVAPGTRWRYPSPPQRTRACMTSAGEHQCLGTAGEQRRRLSGRKCRGAIWRGQRGEMRWARGRGCLHIDMFMASRAPAGDWWLGAVGRAAERAAGQQAAGQQAAGSGQHGSLRAARQRAAERAAGWAVGRQGGRTAGRQGGGQHEDGRAAASEIAHRRPGGRTAPSRAGGAPRRHRCYCTRDYR